MSIHSEVMDNSPEKAYIENLCSDRRTRMAAPCKGCRYRYPVKDDSGRCCIFPTCPSDWGSIREDKVK